MTTFRDNEMQQRYDRIADRDLKKIFLEFSERCKREKIATLPRFSGEGGLALLRERAKEKGYVLGSKIHLQQGMKIADIGTIEFVIEPTISIRRVGVYIDGKKQRRFEKLKNPMLSGFGVEMCLLGWSKFSGMTCTEISEKIKDGVGIEDIIIPSKTTRDAKYILCNGTQMTVRDALEVSCIPYFEYMNKMRGVDESSRQSVFDELSRLHEEESRRGVMRHFNRTWLSVSETDLGIVRSMAKHHAITEQEALHILISENKNKGA